MSYVFPPAAPTTVPVAGRAERFPVHRVYCVGRNYEEHAKEMGFTGREPPFFFMKPADAVVPVEAGATGTIAYPSLTKNLHHEIELVVAIGRSAAELTPETANACIFGYAVGLVVVALGTSPGADLATLARFCDAPLGGSKYETMRRLICDMVAAGDIERTGNHHGPRFYLRGERPS